MPNKRRAGIVTKAVRMPQELKDRLDSVAKAAGKDANSVIIDGMTTELYRLEREIKKNQPKEQ